MALSITCTQNEQAVLVDVVGEVDVSNAPELRDALDGALEKAAEAQGRRIVVDLSQVPYIDSTGIGVLVGITHRAADQEVSVAVERPQRNVARVLALLGLDAELGVTDAGQE